MPVRLFTPAEVNRLIPELERIIAYLRKLDGEIQEKDWRLKQAKVEAHRRDDRVDSYTFLKDEAELDFLRILAQGQFERVQEMGGEVKGGYLVDFPGRVGEQEVLLCWKPGERSVRWYHGLYEGMMGRRPIPEEMLGDQTGEGPSAEPGGETE